MVDALLINFYLLGSSLLVLVVVFCGLEMVHVVYCYVFEFGYCFYFYGDVMFIV